MFGIYARQYARKTGLDMERYTRKTKEFKVYSDVVEQGMILPYKKKYTMRDVNKLEIDSLFNDGPTLSTKTAVFIVKCSAIYHGTDYSKPITRYAEKYPVSF